MWSAVDGVDVVREGEDLLVKAVVPLQRDVHLGAVHFPFHGDGVIEQHRLVLVEQLDVRDDATVVFEIVRLIGALVAHRDAQAGIQESELAHPVRQDVEVEVGRLEDRRVGLESDLRSAQ